MSMTDGEVADVRRDVVVRRSCAAARLLERDCAATPSSPASSSRFASSWIQPVTSVSAGPPFGGLYLKPPSSGGLCDGVTTMPSARRSRRDRGCATRIACEMTGVGV